MAKQDNTPAHIKRSPYCGSASGASIPGWSLTRISLNLFVLCTKGLPGRSSVRS